MLGVSAHSGWAAYVALAGDPTTPDILLRGRMELCDAAIAGSKQPFHAAEPMTFPEAQRFIATCSASTATLADKALSEIEDAIGGIAACCALSASGRALPVLEKILASHALIHAAEGEFYRHAVADACLRRGRAVYGIRAGELVPAAVRSGVSRETQLKRLDVLGKRVGAPWRQDEKQSALGAWLLLRGRPPHEVSLSMQRITAIPGDLGRPSDARILSPETQARLSHEPTH